MPRSRVWRNAMLTVVAGGLALAVWSNRYGPSASPYLHRNRLTGAECHHGLECWIPRRPGPFAAR